MEEQEKLRGRRSRKVDGRRGGVGEVDGRRDAGEVEGRAEQEKLMGGAAEKEKLRGGTLMAATASSGLVGERAAEKNQVPAGDELAGADEETRAR